MTMWPEKKDKAFSERLASTWASDSLPHLIELRKDHNQVTAALHMYLAANDPPTPAPQECPGPVDHPVPPVMPSKPADPYKPPAAPH
jgi:hypothetical protein